MRGKKLRLREKRNELWERKFCGKKVSTARELIAPSSEREYCVRILGERHGSSEKKCRGIKGRGNCERRNLSRGHGLVPLGAVFYEEKAGLGKGALQLKGKKMRRRGDIRGIFPGKTLPFGHEQGRAWVYQGKSRVPMDNHKKGRRERKYRQVCGKEGLENQRRKKSLSDELNGPAERKNLEDTEKEGARTVQRVMDLRRGVWGKMGGAFSCSSKTSLALL